MILRDTSDVMSHYAVYCVVLEARCSVIKITTHQDIILVMLSIISALFSFVAIINKNRIHEKRRGVVVHVQRNDGHL